MTPLGAIDLVAEHGAVADGATDNLAAFNSAIASIPDCVSPWSDARGVGAGTIYLRASSPSAYRLSGPVTIPAGKSVRIVGDGQTGARITSDTGVAFVRAAPTTPLCHFGLEGLTLDDCTVEVVHNSRHRHDFDHVSFHGAGAGIVIRSEGQVEGASGSVVHGRISQCEFYCCDAPIVCQGVQCDGWEVVDCTFARSGGADILTHSSGWVISECYFEVHETGTDPKYPHINIRYGVCTVERNRFGNEVSVNGGPPREPIVIGDVDTPEAGALPGIKIVGNIFRGRGDTGPTANSANACVRITKGTLGLLFSGNTIHDHYECVIDLAMTGTGTGRHNVVEIEGGGREMPVFSVEPDQGPLGGWLVRGAGVPDTAYEGIAGQLLEDTETIHIDWTVAGSGSVAKDATGPDGIASSAFSLTRTGAGTLTIACTPAAAVPGGAVSFACWLRRAGGSSVRKASLLVSAGTYLQDLALAATLTEQWRRYWVTVQTQASDQLTYYIRSGVSGDTDDTGVIEIYRPRANYGYAPSE